MPRADKVDLRAFQQELAARLAKKTEAEVASSRLAFACAGMRWLVRLADAGEVASLPQITPVPLTQPWFLGVASIRGNLYSVVDLAAFLGRGDPQPLSPGVRSRLLVFGPRAGEVRAALVVDRVLGLSNLALLARAAAPADAPAWYGERWIDADGGTWQEIDLVALARDPAFLKVGL